MTNQQKADMIVEAAHALQAATIANSPNKITLKLELRDVIKAALIGTLAESISKDFCDLYAPLCEPFDVQRLLDLAEEWRATKNLPNRIKGKVIDDKMGL